MLRARPQLHQQTRIEGESPPRTEPLTTEEDEDEANSIATQSQPTELLVHHFSASHGDTSSVPEHAPTSSSCPTSSRVAPIPLPVLPISWPRYDILVPSSRQPRLQQQTAPAVNIGVSEGVSSAMSTLGQQQQHHHHHHRAPSFEHYYPSPPLSINPLALSPPLSAYRFPMPPSTSTSSSNLLGGVGVDQSVSVDALSMGEPETETFSSYFDLELKPSSTQQRSFGGWPGATAMPTPQSVPVSPTSHTSRPLVFESSYFPPQVPAHDLDISHARAHAQAQVQPHARSSSSSYPHGKLHQQPPPYPRQHQREQFPFPAHAAAPFAHRAFSGPSLQIQLELDNAPPCSSATTLSETVPPLYPPLWTPLLPEEDARTRTNTSSHQLNGRGNESNMSKPDLKLELELEHEPELLAPLTMSFLGPAVAASSSSFAPTVLSTSSYCAKDEMTPWTISDIDDTEAVNLAGKGTIRVEDEELLGLGRRRGGKTMRRPRDVLAFYDDHDDDVDVDVDDDLDASFVEFEMDMQVGRGQEVGPEGGDFLHCW